MASPLFNSTQSYVLSHAQRFLFQTKNARKQKKEKNIGQEAIALRNAVSRKV